MGKCVIIAAMWAGEERAFLEPAPEDLLLCADRGYAAARQAGWRPALTAGDFDSLPAGIAPEGPVLRLPVRKDETDTAVCVRIGRERGCREFRVGGGLGGRLDHSLANLQLAAACAVRGERLWLCDPQNRLTVLAPGRHVLPAVPGRKLSLLAFSDEVTGVCLEGAEWPLTGAVLRSTEPLGVSNEWRAPEAVLSFGSGLLTVLFSGDGAAPA